MPGLVCRGLKLKLPTLNNKNISLEDLLKVSCIPPPTAQSSLDLVTNRGSNFSQIRPLWVNRDRPEFIFYIDQLRFYQQNSALEENTNLIKVIRPLKSLAQMFPLIQIVILEWEGGAEARRGEGGTHDFIRSNYYHIDLPLCEQINFNLNKLRFETIKLPMINFPLR